MFTGTTCLGNEPGVGAPLALIIGNLLLPLEEHEREFLTRLLDYGEIRPSLLTEDEKLAAKLEIHLGLLWKALNVRQFKRR